MALLLTEEYFDLKIQKNYFLQKIKVDCGLIKSGIRCDYAIDVDISREPIIKSEDGKSDKIYLIELKGSDKDMRKNKQYDSLEF